jgi:hypothetical protein
MELRAFMKELQEIWPAYGYFPEPSKSILVVTHSLVPVRSNFKDLGFQATTGSHYQGGFDGSSFEH